MLSPKLQIVMIKRGEIYLADLNRVTEHNISKVRPVLVFQNDFLNRTLEEAFYADVTIIPLSSKDLGGDYRLKISARDALEQPSEIVCNAVCTINVNLLKTDSGPIAVLNDKEIKFIERMLADLFGCRI